MSKRAVDLVFSATYLLVDLRMILRETAPTHELSDKQKAEAARLLSCQTVDVQADRLTATLSLASRFHACVVLKGCGSVIATPKGHWYINGSGHPGMASAGMGDVLTGLVASLLAQGWAAEPALIAAVHLHGAAADQLARQGIGPIGLTAGEVIDAARRLFNDWLEQARHPR